MPDAVEPVEFTPAEVDVLKSLARQMGTPAVEFSAELVEDEGFDERTRKIVRAEIASLAGKALRRTQDRNYTRSPDRNIAVDVANEELAEFWGEVLAEYGSDG
jgi:hypothetical protein